MSTVFFCQRRLPLFFIFLLALSILVPGATFFSPQVQLRMSEAPTRQAPSSSTASSTNASPPHPQHAKPGPLRPAGGAKSGEGEKKFTVGFIGGGMMASALIRGLVKAGVVPNFAISVSDPYKPMRDKLAAEVGVIAYDDNIQVIEVRFKSM